MTTWSWLLSGGVGGVLLAVFLLWLKKAVAEEVSTRVGALPHFAVAVAARLLPRSRRDDYRDEWMSDAEQLITDTDGKPLTRIAKNAVFAISLMLRARTIRRHIPTRPPAHSQPHSRLFISSNGLGAVPDEQMHKILRVLGPDVFSLNQSEVKYFSVDNRNYVIRRENDAIHIDAVEPFTDPGN